MVGLLVVKSKAVVFSVVVEFKEIAVESNAVVVTDKNLVVVVAPNVVAMIGLDVIIAEITVDEGKVVVVELADVVALTDVVVVTSTDIVVGLTDVEFWFTKSETDFNVIAVVIFLLAMENNTSNAETALSSVILNLRLK